MGTWDCGVSALASRASPFCHLVITFGISKMPQLSHTHSALQPACAINANWRAIRIWTAMPGGTPRTAPSRHRTPCPARPPPPRPPGRPLPATGRLGRVRPRCRITTRSYPQTFVHRTPQVSCPRAPWVPAPPPAGVTATRPTEAVFLPRACKAFQHTDLPIPADAGKLRDVFCNERLVCPVASCLVSGPRAGGYGTVQPGPPTRNLMAGL